jgi:hypothetical protein
MPTINEVFEFNPKLILMIILGTLILLEIGYLIIRKRGKR